MGSFRKTGPAVCFRAHLTGFMLPALHYRLLPFAGLPAGQRHDGMEPPKHVLDTAGRYVSQ